MLNKVQIIGHLGQDPDCRKMQSGDSVTSFSLAVTDKWKCKNTGERKEKTEWIPVVIFGKVAEIAEKYLSKGSKVFIEGQFKTRSWEQDGATKYKSEVVLQGFDSKMIMLDSRSDSAPVNKVVDHQAPHDGGLSDEIPFNRLMDDQFY